MNTYSKWFKTEADDKQLFDALIQATSKSGATIFKTIKHNFYPKGFTGVVVLGESHTAIHTFPEIGEAWVEIVSCSDKINAEVFFSVFGELISVNP